MAKNKVLKREKTKKTSKKKIKEIPLKMEWNPGVHKYEPELPPRKTDKKQKIEVDWTFIGLLIIVAIIGLFIVLRSLLL